MTAAALLAAVRAHTRRLTHPSHGHDGEIEARIEIAWAHALAGRWDGAERAVHHLQAAHPDALLALVHVACDRALASRPDIVARVDLLDDSAGNLAAWLVVARGLGETRALRGMVDRHTDEGQRELAVALLRYATEQAVTR